MSLVARRLAGAAALFVVVVVAAPRAAAEELRDPTRPPAALLAASPESRGPHDGPVLQSVMIGSGRRAAMISGTWVELGGRYHDARVVAITEAGVTLQGPGGKQQLKLFPEVEKRISAKERTPNRRNGHRTPLKEEKSGDP
ncbi:MAG: hypothetical protein DI596_02030 [Azospira oryzae]|nr:MAG: hypothetical protein DI596_02030 [Azospira oryzae]PZP82374.1 MAG: hypothetical protein DI593_02030 [Azospira oryzae]